MKIPLGPLYMDEVPPQAEGLHFVKRRHNGTEWTPVRVLDAGT